MTTEESSLRERIVHADDDLCDLLRILLDRATHRQMWLMFIDRLGRIGDPIMPMDDYPLDPHEMTTVDDLGTVSQARLLMARMRMFLEATGHESILLVWERTGDDSLKESERAWAAAMAQQARELDVPIRAQLLLHDDGVRQLYPDDYVALDEGTR